VLREAVIKLIRAHDASSLDPNDIDLENAELDAFGDLRAALASHPAASDGEGVETFAVVQHAILDPRSYTPRNWNEVAYEPLSRWQARAVCIAMSALTAKQSPAPEGVEEAIARTGRSAAIEQMCDAVHDAMKAAFIAGCEAAHENYQEDRDPDFSEAASDYAANADFTDVNNAILSLLPQEKGNG